MSNPLVSSQILGQTPRNPVYVAISMSTLVWGVFLAIWLWFISFMVTSAILSTLAFFVASLFGLALLGST